MCSVHTMCASAPLLLLWRQILEILALAPVCFLGARHSYKRWLTRRRRTYYSLASSHKSSGKKESKCFHFNSKRERTRNSANTDFFFLSLDVSRNDVSLGSLKKKRKKRERKGKKLLSLNVSTHCELNRTRVGEKVWADDEFWCWKNR